MLARPQDLFAAALACAVLSACAGGGTASGVPRHVTQSVARKAQFRPPMPGSRVFSYQIVSVQEGHNTMFFQAPQAVHRSAAGIDVTRSDGRVFHFSNTAAVGYGSGQSFVQPGQALPRFISASAKQIGVVKADGTY